MDAQRNEGLVEDRLRILNVICAALIGSVFLYGLVAWIVIAQGEIAVSDALKQVPVLPYVLAAFGLGALAAAPVISRMVQSRGKESAEPSDPGQTFARYQSSVIVGFAMRESAAVFGLVASFLTGEMIWVGVLGAAAVLAMAAAWPRKDAVLSLLAEGPTPIG